MMFLFREVAKMKKTLRLLLGDELNSRHTWFGSADDSITYLMMEIDEEMTYVTHHIQKIVAYLASMRNFAKLAQKPGIRFAISHLMERNKQSLVGNTIEQIEQHGFECFEYLLPTNIGLTGSSRIFVKKSI